MVEYLHELHRDPERCKYASKICKNKRAYKRNGKLHNLCEYHRLKASENQRRRMIRQKQRQFQDLQTFVSETFTSPTDTRALAFTDFNPIEYRYVEEEPLDDAPVVGFDPFRGYFRDDSPEEMYWSSFGHLTPIRCDDDHQIRELTFEEIEIVCTLLEIP